MRTVSSIAALGLAMAGTPAQAEIPVSPLSDIYLTFNDCLEVAQPTGISTAKLSSLGWVKATTSNAKGKGERGPLVYGHANRKPLIILSAESGDGICIVAARIESAKAYPKFLEAWGPNLPKPDKDGVIGFYDDGHPVLIRQTGSRDEPALTMTVGTPSEKK